MPVINACLARRFLMSICETHLSTSQFLQYVGDVWFLFTSKNAVKQCSVIKVTKAPLSIRGFRLYTLIMLTISVIKLYQYWVWFRIKTAMDLIALNKGLIAKSKEGISLIVFDFCLEDFRTSGNTCI